MPYTLPAVFRQSWLKKQPLAILYELRALMQEDIERRAMHPRDQRILRVNDEIERRPRAYDKSKER